MVDAVTAGIQGMWQKHALAEAAVLFVRRCNLPCYRSQVSIARELNSDFWILTSSLFRLLPL
jgi:hypothetical protein